MGLTLHRVLNGVALAAAVQHGNDGAGLAGFGTFLVIFLHKPFDAMTIGMLMARGGRSLAWRHTVNALFSLAIPVGVLFFYFGLPETRRPTRAPSNRSCVAYALAFSAGTLSVHFAQRFVARVAVSPARPREAVDRAVARPGRGDGRLPLRKRRSQAQRANHGLPTPCGDLGQSARVIASLQTQPHPGV